MACLYTIIKDNAPEQYTFPFDLRSIEIMREVIRRTFNVYMSGVSVWRALKALGMPARRPKYAAYQQGEEAARKFKGRISRPLGDEAAVRSECRGGTARGETSATKAAGERFSVSMPSAIDGEGRMRFMAAGKTCTTPAFIDFLKRLLFKRKEPAFLIADGHAVHKSKRAEGVCRVNGRRIKVVSSTRALAGIKSWRDGMGVCKTSCHREENNQRARVTSENSERSFIRVDA
jgi:hypothetical protein